MRHELTFQNYFKKRLWNFFSSGHPMDYELEALRKIVLLNLIISSGGLFLLFLGTVAFIQHNNLLAAADFSFLIFLCALFLYLRIKKDYRLVALIGTSVTGLFFFFLIANGGVHNSAFVWSFTYPLIALYLLGVHTGTVFSALLLAASGCIFALQTSVSFLPEYSIHLIIRFIPAYISIYLFAFLTEKLHQIVQQRLRDLNSNLEKVIEELETANKEKADLIHELHATVQEVQILQGILPICANCKKIRDDKGYWNQVEQYIQERSKATFSHGICPECMEKLYPELKTEKDGMMNRGIYKKKG
jgi:uncharacterized protein (UPF0335 family)